MNSLPIRNLGKFEPNVTYWIMVGEKDGPLPSDDDLEEIKNVLEANAPESTFIITNWCITPIMEGVSDGKLQNVRPQREVRQNTRTPKKSGTQTRTNRTQRKTANNNLKNDDGHRRKQKKQNKKSEHRTTKKNSSTASRKKHR